MNQEHTENVYGLRREAEEFPMMCVIGLSYVCNSKCPHCPYTESEIRADYRDSLFMKDGLFRLIADQCGEHNAWIRISGAGEPMMHRNAVELMEYAKTVGARVGLITNGSLFTSESITRLLEAGVDMIEFSVDASDQESYERVRKGLNWDRLVKNVREAVELRNKLKSKTKIIASGVNQQGIDIDEVASFWEPLVDVFQKRKYLSWGLIDSSKSADPAPYLMPEDHVPCPLIFERINIDSRGKVIVCGYDIAAVTDLGNVHESSISEIWHGKEFEYYRRMHLERRGHEIEMCSKCPDWKYRSWKHNYWKIVKNAETSRVAKIK